MFIALLLQKGWKVLALTPDAAALMSRLAQQGLADAPELHVLDYAASAQDSSWSAQRVQQALLSRLRRAWARWNAFGDRYYYRRPGSEAVPGAPFLVYWKRRFFQMAVPFPYRATYFVHARSRRLFKMPECPGAAADPEAGFLDPAEFAARVSAALRRSPWKPDLVFNMYMDMYRSSSISWNKFAAINKWPWAGIRFVPAGLPQEGYYRLSSLKGMCFLDDDVRSAYREARPDKVFGYLPDITETALPDQPGALAQEIRHRASGRKIVFLGGSIGGQKNLARWYEVVALADPSKWYFVQIGEVHRGTLTAADVAALDKNLVCPPENLFIKSEYLPDERAFNDIIRTADVIYAVYRDFRISSNMLGKAAAFEKPILVADNYLMGARVRAYRIGRGAPQEDAEQIHRALLSLTTSAPSASCFKHYRDDFGSKALAVNLGRFIEQCIGQQPEACADEDSGHAGKPGPSACERERSVPSMKCALVTGGSGYIGSRLVARLVAEGWRVHVILRPSSSLSLLESCASRITIHRHKGSTDEMLEIVSAARPDVVFHLAAMASAEHRPESVDQMIASNVLYSAQLAEGMMRSGVKNLVNTETFWQYGDGSDRYEPAYLYAATKQAFRDILQYYVRVDAIRAISLVLFDTYGPGDPRKKLFGFLKEAARENRSADMTPGEQIVDMTHVNDVVDAYVHAGEMLLRGGIDNFETYAVTSGRRMKLKELVALAAQETGLPIHPNWGGREYRPNEIMVPWLGTPLPGWRPKTDLESGIREIFAEP